MNNKEIYHDPALNLSWAERTMCSVVEDILNVLKSGHENGSISTTDTALLTSLTHEVQVYGHRMEAKLSDVQEFDKMKERYNELKKDVEQKEKTPIRRVTEFLPQGDNDDE